MGMTRQAIQKRIEAGTIKAEMDFQKGVYLISEEELQKALLTRRPPKEGALSVDEVAKRLHVSVRTLRRYMKDGKIAYFQDEKRKIWIEREEHKRIMKASRGAKVYVDLKKLL